MKKIFYTLFVISLLLSTLTFNSCSEDPTPSIYDVIEPSPPIPVGRYYDFDDTKSPKEIPYAVTVDAQGGVYVSLDGLGVKKIVADTLAIFSPPTVPQNNAPFFRALTVASDNNVYGARGVKGVYKMSQNVSPAAFVAGGQGIADNINDIEFVNSQNVFWAGGNTGIIYRITFDKNVKKFNLLTGTGIINAIKIGNNNLYVAMRDTNNQELVWKFPVVSSDSLGEGQLFFNFTEKVDTVAKINDLAVAADGDVYIFTNTQSVAIYVVHPDNSYGEFYNGLIDGSIYSFFWGMDNNAYFTNIKVNVNTDVWKVDMKKLAAQ